MRRTLAFLPEADIEEAAVWYEARRPGLGIEFVTAIDEALDGVARAPESHATWGEDDAYRRRLVRRFPFVVFFRVMTDEVRIVAIAHAKSRPGYWLGRGA